MGQSVRCGGDGDPPGQGGVPRGDERFSEVYDRPWYRPSEWIDRRGRRDADLHPGRPRPGSGLERCQPQGHIWTLRTARRPAFAWFNDQAEALKEAGLEPRRSALRGGIGVLPGARTRRWPGPGSAPTPSPAPPPHRRARTSSSARPRARRLGAACLWPSPCSSARSPDREAARDRPFRESSPGVRASPPIAPCPPPGSARSRAESRRMPPRRRPAGVASRASSARRSNLSAANAATRSSLVGKWR